MLFLRATIALTLLQLATWPLPALSDEPVDFARDIQPIFQKHCLKCHGGVHREGGLSLLAPGGADWAGDSGNRVVIAGKPTQSELIRRVTSSDADERMPAGKPPLAREEIDRLRLWIEQGASWPRHWSLAPLRDSRPPAIPGSARDRNAIDAFVLQRLESGSIQIQPSPEADETTLVRRLYLDLIGLPPNLEELAKFVAPDAYERLVDRLLANPHFGERWGRHWLDQARYADSDGYEVDKARPDAYRWRDWVIAAINSDIPFDEFTVLQFAGDMLPERKPESHLATAYHRQTFTNNEGGVDKEEYRFKAVMDRVSNTGSVWLGLTLGCAQCHDHPYDVFTQREFYSLAAIFNNADETEIELSHSTSTNSKRPKFRVLTECNEPRITRLLKRGEFLTPRDEVEPGLPSLLPATPHSAIRTPQSPTRLDLAHWLIDPSNPLTPRVQANQIWLHLFGAGLVRTPEDFGVRSEQPTHPELLDWLATELLTRGWSRKAMIRQIVESATYRQSSHHRPELTSDPENRLLARQNRVRVEAEIVRDLFLASGGLLSATIGGPSVYPPLSPEFVKITFRSELPWKVSPGEDRYRRGMYTFFKRSVPYPDLMIFDCPDSNSAAVRRPSSNTPLQALLTLNSETFVEAARGLARKGSGRYSGGSTRGIQGSEQAVETMFRTCFVRNSTADELSALTVMHEQHRRWYESHPDQAVLMAGDIQIDVVAPAHAAALVATANVIMNLDEFITRE